MLQIRRNVFETNSSSTHSLNFATSSEYEKWADGEVLFVNDDCIADKKFINIDEAKDIVREYEFNNTYTYCMPLDDYYYKHNIENGIPYTHIDDVPDDLVIPYLGYFNMFTMDAYFDDYCDWYETYNERYTTKNGDEIVAFGYYGHS